jgi:hypothetical protein
MVGGENAAMHRDKAVVADFHAAMAVYHGVRANEHVPAEGDCPAVGMEHDAGLELQVDARRNPAQLAVTDVLAHIDARSNEARAG